VWFEGEEASARLMAERLVYTLEIWVAAMTGEALPETGDGDLLQRHERASLAFARLARRIRDRGAWDDAFVDALCEPPQSFTYGGVISHVLAFGAVRREALASVLRELGADVPSSGDPIDWEASR
jgi:AraC family transcriptional regulator